MLYPSINTLREKADSKYTLVSLAAKRARDVIDGKPILAKSGIKRPVSIAVEEIAADMITYNRDENMDEEMGEIEQNSSHYIPVVNIDADEETDNESE